MQNDYDESNYDDNGENRTVFIKRLLIGAVIVVGIIILILLLKNIKFKNDDKKIIVNYDVSILQAGKQYYDVNKQKLPTVSGECSSVTLETLSQLKLLNINDYNDCDSKNTYVKVCMLESKSLQWTPWLACSTNNSETKYSKFFEGTESNLVKDVSNVKFEFLAQKVDAKDSSLGEVEELWKDEIEYDSYKTIDTIDYYRYRDKEYLWNIKLKSYYTSKGSEADSDKANEYYIKAPEGYTDKEDGTTVYKWFTSNSNKEYYMVNGSKGFSATPVDGYPYNDGGKIITKYRYRYISSYYEPTLFNKCSESSTSVNYEYLKTPCGTGKHPTYTYKVKSYYVCADPGNNNVDMTDKGLTKDSVCNTYSDWSNLQDETCGVDSHICQSQSVTFYNWYKLTGSSVKTYYPSGSTVESGEKIYYKESPTPGAQKDESTKTEAYKWYKNTPGETTKYFALSPQEGATIIKSSEKWSSWSQWQTFEPDDLGVDGTRQVENKTKIKLQKINEITDNDWTNIKEGYVEEKSLIKIFNDAGYEVESLKDITNNGDIRYKIKLFIRNKEGQK